MQIFFHEAYLRELISAPRYFYQIFLLLVLPTAGSLPTIYVMIVIQGLTYSYIFYQHLLRIVHIYVYGTYSYMGIKQNTATILAFTIFLSRHSKGCRIG